MRQPADDEDDASPGTWMVRLDDPMESVEDPMGLQRPADHDDAADAGDLADALSELPEARIVRTPGTPREVLESDAAPLAREPPSGRARARPAPASSYPEWDYRLGAYRFPRGDRAARAGARRRRRLGRATSWPATRPWCGRCAVASTACGPRRVRLGRQADGAELDLGAYVTAFADWRAGEPGDDRLYTASRPARRDLAIAAARRRQRVDRRAGSAASLRIVDVEKESLVVLLEALDVLGDRHAVLAFSGRGRAPCTCSP